jgi:hypothetical protein
MNSSKPLKVTFSIRSRAPDCVREKKMPKACRISVELGPYFASERRVPVSGTLISRLT